MLVLQPVSRTNTQAGVQYISLYQLKHFHVGSQETILCVRYVILMLFSKLKLGVQRNKSICLVHMVKYQPKIINRGFRGNKACVGMLRGRVERHCCMAGFITKVKKRLQHFTKMKPNPPLKAQLKLDFLYLKGRFQWKLISQI